MTGAKVDFNKILDRVSSGLVGVDSTTTQINKSTKGHVYLPGLPTLYEPQCAEELMSWWVKNHSNDFQNTSHIETSHPYPNNKKNKCDIVFSTDGIWPNQSNQSLPEWAIEFKKIVFVGDNGKNNDYGPSKFISPFLKDRSLAHDVIKLKQANIARKKAVIGYGFNYDLPTLNLALQKFPQHSDRIKNAIKVCKLAGMPNNKLDLDYLLQIADFIIQKQNVTAHLKTRNFTNAWKHPLGGNGVVFGWEIL
jgi:hypothetical protein